MTLHVKSGGAWVEPSAVHIKNGGAWQAVQEIWIKDGGTWQQVFSAWSLTDPLTGATIGDSFLLGDTSYAGVRFNTDGSIDYTANNALNWNQAGVSSWASGTPPATYYIRATQTAGSTPTSGTLGTWQAMTSARSWHNSRTTVGTKTSTLLIELSSSASGPAETSAAFVLNAIIEA